MTFQRSNSLFPIASSLAIALLVLAATPVSAQLSERDQKFAAMLDGARFEGQFNVSTPQSAASTDSQQATSAPRPDLYSVSKLVPGEDNTWIFEYTMSYGQGPDGPKTTVPIPVTVEWAGDTPVLTMTDQTVQGLGTFTVRVMIYGDRYAGTWQNGPIGGHMWGRIVRDP